MPVEQHFTAKGGFPDWATPPISSNHLQHRYNAEQITPRGFESTGQNAAKLENRLGVRVEGTIMRKEEMTKLVGLLELSVGSGRTATALLFDNMRWMLDFAEPRIPYELGCTVTFVEDDGGDFVPLEKPTHGPGPSMQKSN